MSIKVKLIILAVCSLVATLTIGLILFQSTITVRQEIEKEGTISEIQNKIIEREILRSDYFLYHEERPIAQLRVVSVVLDQLLIRAQGQGLLVDRLGENKKFIDQALSQIIASPSAQLEQSLVSQVLIKSQENSTIVSQLANASRNQVIQSQQRATFFVLLFILGISLIIIIVLYLIWRSIGAPLIAFKESVVRLAALDFTTTTTTTTTTTSDGGELGELGLAFNQMVGKLKAAYQERTEQLVKLGNAKKAMFNVMEDLEEAKAVIETEKVQAETILASIGDGIIATSPDKRILVINKVAEKLLGWKSGEVLGKFYDDVVSLEDEAGTFVPPEKRPLAQAFAHATTTTTTTSTRLFLVSKNKIKFPVAITVSPVILDNKIIGAVEVFRDITEEKAVDKAKTEFVSLASHQLRTPLSTINWYSEMLLSLDVGKLTSKQKQYGQEVYHASQRMVKLVNALLNVSRLELGTFAIEPEIINVIDIAKMCLKELGPQILKKKLIISQKYDEGISAISADPQTYYNNFSEFAF